MTKDRLQYLVDRFLNNTATEEELREYNDWYAEQQDKGLNLYEHNDAAVQDYANQLFGRISSDIHYREHQQQQQVKRSRTILYRWVAAAAIVCLVSSAIWYWGINKPNSPAIVVTTTLQKQLTRFANTSDTIKHLSLPDGSMVELYSNSALHYENDYGTSNRNIWLTGKGFFKVVKDSTKPFTVYSGDISTTALGTSFTITAYPANAQVNVLLHTGKVVVKQLPSQQPAHMEPVYLIQGQEVVCDFRHGLAKVKQSVTQPSLKKQPSIGSRAGFTATFDQQPLAEVLETIAKGYDVPIQYNKGSLNDMVFSGSIRKTDSLAKVLQRMAALHNLTIKATTKGYKINSNQ